MFSMAARRMSTQAAQTPGSMKPLLTVLAGAAGVAVAFSAASALQAAQDAKSVDKAALQRRRTNPDTLKGSPHCD